MELKWNLTYWSLLMLIRHVITHFSACLLYLSIYTFVPQQKAMTLFASSIAVIAKDIMFIVCLLLLHM